MTYPSGNYHKSAVIRDIMQQYLPEIFMKSVNDFVVSRKINMMNNFEFLAGMTLIRNWKSGCCICFNGTSSEQKMGQICGRGCTKITILKLCGHAICESCYQSFRKNKNEQLNCPLCRHEIVYEVFVAEDVKVNGALANAIIASCITTIKNHVKLYE